MERIRCQNYPCLDILETLVREETEALRAKGINPDTSLINQCLEWTRDLFKGYNSRSDYAMPGFKDATSAYLKVVNHYL